MSVDFTEVVPVGSTVAGVEKDSLAIKTPDGRLVFVNVGTWAQLPGIVVQDNELTVVGPLTGGSDGESSRT